MCLAELAANLTFTGISSGSGLSCRLELDFCLCSQQSDGFSQVHVYNVRAPSCRAGNSLTWQAILFKHPLAGQCRTQAKRASLHAPKVALVISPRSNCCIDAFVEADVCRVAEPAVDFPTMCLLSARNAQKASPVVCLLHQQTL